MRNFLGGFFGEEFFGRIFWGGYFWKEFFREEFFENNSFFTLLKSAKLSGIDLFVKILSESTRKEGKFQSFEVRVQAYHT